MKNKNRGLNILMNGVFVGILEKKNNAGLTFTYDENWITNPGARPISLSLPLFHRPFTGDVVYNFFDNLLPDNPQIRARIQAAFQTPTNQAFDLLASIGKDCIGAIQIIDSSAPAFKKQIHGKPLSEKEIATLLRDYQNHPLGMTDASDEFRVSIAGAQEKTALLYYRKKWQRPSGTTPTSHIFKLPIGYIQHQHIDLSDSCENEWLCSQIAQAFGLPVAKSEILHFEKTKVLVIERFDRKLSRDKKWLMRLPQEDVCQALGISSHLKYQSDGGPGIQAIMHLLLGSENSATDRDTFFALKFYFGYWRLLMVTQKTLVCLLNQKENID